MNKDRFTKYFIIEVNVFDKLVHKWDKENGQGDCVCTAWDVFRKSYNLNEQEMDNNTLIKEMIEKAISEEFYWDSLPEGAFSVNEDGYLQFNRFEDSDGSYLSSDDHNIQVYIADYTAEVLVNGQQLTQEELAEIMECEVI